MLVVDIAQFRRYSTICCVHPSINTYDNSTWAGIMSPWRSEISGLHLIRELPPQRFLLMHPRVSKSRLCNVIGFIFRDGLPNLKELSDIGGEEEGSL